MIDLSTPEAMIAQHFMRKKGYKNVAPVEVEKVDGQTTWYFVYDLPEGILELEVAWTEKDGWVNTVTLFELHG
jgi:hypothetical protein